MRKCLQNVYKQYTISSAKDPLLTVENCHTNSSFSELVIIHGTIYAYERNEHYIQYLMKEETTTCN